MSRQRWYPRYPADFIAGTIGLTLEEKGAYSVVLDLIYANNGPVVDDARYISGVCGCSIRRWNAIREKLIEVGKLVVVDGHLSNPRAASELEKTEKISGKNRDNGRKGGDKKAENASRLNENKDLAVASRARLTGQYIIEDSLRSSSNTGSSFHSEPPPTAPDKPAGRGDATGFPEKAFEAFWDAYPAKVGKAAAQRKFDAIRKSGRVPFDRLMAGLEAYKRHKPADREWCHPTTWLNQGRWEDEHAGAPSTAAVVRPVVNVSCTDARWRRLSERYRSEGRPPPTAGGAWAFPIEWIDDLEQVA